MKKYNIAKNTLIQYVQQCYVIISDRIRIVYSHELNFFPRKNNMDMLLYIFVDNLGIVSEFRDC